MERFVALATSPQFLAARGHAAPALLPGLSRQAGSSVSRPGGDECGNSETWSSSTPFDSIVTFQSLYLSRDGNETACDGLQMRELRTFLHQSAGITPATFIKRLSARYGPPMLDLLSLSDVPISYGWAPLNGYWLRVSEPNASGEFLFKVERDNDAVTSVPSDEEVQKWMDDFVALITGPRPWQERGAAIPALFDDLRPKEGGEGGCPTEYEAKYSPASPPFVSSVLVRLQPVANAPCDRAKLADVMVSLDRIGPISVDAIAFRVAGRLGLPTSDPAADRRYADRGITDHSWRLPSGSLDVSEVRMLSEKLPQALLQGFVTISLRQY